MVGPLTGTWAVLLAISGAGLLHARVAGVPQTAFRHLYSLHPTGRIVIQNLYGDVQIAAWDRDQVLVEAIKKSRDPKRLDDARIVIGSTYELLTIATQYAGIDAEQPASVEYRIMVPRNANLENVRLINGGLSISGLAGPVKASSVNGSIRAEGLEGQADLSTVNGRLEVGFRRIESDDAILLSSVNGPIRLVLPPDAEANVEARNLSGGIDSSIGQTWRAAGGHRMRSAGKKGGAHIRLHNVNGGISIRSTATSRTSGPWS
jgi:putative adhesin